jgi:hypothetical protein
VSVAFRAGSGGSNNATTTSFVPTLPTGTAVGDITLIFVECNNADVLYGAATSGWVKLAEHQNFIWTNITGVVYGIVWTDHPGRPDDLVQGRQQRGRRDLMVGRHLLPGRGRHPRLRQRGRPGNHTAPGTSFPVAPARDGQ